MIVILNISFVHNWEKICHRHCYYIPISNLAAALYAAVTVANGDTTDASPVLSMAFL